MSFGTRQNLLGAAVGIMGTSGKWQSTVGGDQPSVWNALECLGAKFSGRAEAREICISCGTFRGPPKQPLFLGGPRSAAGLAGLVCAGLCEDTGRDFCTAGTSVATSMRAAGEGRVVATECSHRELPFLTALLIKELLFLAL